MKKANFVLQKNSLRCIFYLMKVLIIGPLGAGKSSLAYQLNKKFHLPRLNLDEVCRIKESGKYRPPKGQHSLIKKFLTAHPSWVMEGCQKNLYEQVKPDLIIDMRLHRLTTIFRFTKRFLKAKKLIGKKIPSDLPVQAYHYRPITFSKIKEWDKANCEINAQIDLFLRITSTPVIRCRGYRDYAKVFSYLSK